MPLFGIMIDLKSTIQNLMQIKQVHLFINKTQFQSTNDSKRFFTVVFHKFIHTL